MDSVVDEGEVEAVGGRGGEWTGVSQDLWVSTVSTSQIPPSRAVKMYRNAAREFGRGYSAGQAMWK